MSTYRHHRTIIDTINEELTHRRYLEAADQTRNLADSIGQSLGSCLSSGRSIDRNMLEDIRDTLDTIMNHPNFDPKDENTATALNFQSSFWALHRFIRGMLHAMPIT